MENRIKRVPPISSPQRVSSGDKEPDNKLKAQIKADVEYLAAEWANNSDTKDFAPEAVLISGRLAGAWKRRDDYSEQDAIESLKTIVHRSDDENVAVGTAEVVSQKVHGAVDVTNDADGVFKRATAILCLCQINSPAANDALFDLLMDLKNTSFRACGLGTKILVQTNNPKVRDVLVSAAQHLDADGSLLAKGRANSIRRALGNESV